MSGTISVYYVERIPMNRAPVISFELQYGSKIEKL